VRGALRCSGGSLSQEWARSTPRLGAPARWRAHACSVCCPAAAVRGARRTARVRSQMDTTADTARVQDAWTSCRGTSAWQPWRLRFAWDGYGAVRSAVLPCPFGLALFRGSGTLELRRRRAWRSGAVGGEPACSQQRLVQAEVLPGVQCGCVGRLPGWTQRRVACPGPAALSCHR